ncbi:hypothetical protein Tco_0548858, partial [Tanacetum coccineum]
GDGGRISSSDPAID